MEARLQARGLKTAVLLAALTIAGSARAAEPARDECISANEDADTLRKKGSLQSAREKLTLCTHAVCPRLVRDDCATRLSDLETAVPTVVLSAREGAKDVTAVTVTIDGKPLATTLDGKPIDLDPGVHTFTFRYAAYPEQTQQLLIREGEKNRGVGATFGEAAAPPAPSVLYVPGPTVDRKDQEKKKDTTPWVIGGASVILVGLLTVVIIAIATSGDDKAPTTVLGKPAGDGSLGGLRLMSFR